jgi:cytochrome c peroxidase
VLADTVRAFDGNLLALEGFQQSPAEFAPYSSHHDAVLRGQATLSEQEARGLPRTRAIAANADPKFFDLGLCGPLRTDRAHQPDYCGRFCAPSLRNVALRDRFFHNAGMRTLADAVRFYVERDTRPERWYKTRQNDRDRKYNDMPAVYHRNVDTVPPLRRPAGRDTPAQPARHPGHRCLPPRADRCGSAAARSPATGSTLNAVTKGC